MVTHPSGRKQAISPKYLGCRCTDKDLFGPDGRPWMSPEHMLHIHLRMLKQRLMARLAGRAEE